MPWPLQEPHFSLGTLPLPSQVPQTRVLANAPRMERRVSWMRPEPLQVGQVSSAVPSLPPEPEQTLQVETRERSTVRLVPKIASLNGTSRSIEMSRPLGVLRPEPPRLPKKSPKMSPISNSTPPPPN